MVSLVILYRVSGGQEVHAADPSTFLGRVSHVQTHHHGGASSSIYGLRTVQEAVHFYQSKSFLGCPLMEDSSKIDDTSY